jgi:hypothetical protein
MSGPNPTVGNGHDAMCESELTSHGYTPCRCEERMPNRGDVVVGGISYGGH